ncbi:ParM/StbA family protein [Priestia megaterium]|uniref:ParM/StbA family protein n=1 Tax=Priestia megaterium TaxID=1404 RepID=UPI002E20F55F|nr:ParM/StbA family protein [Priestia megaterium]
MILGIDSGSSAVKVATEKGVSSFPSCLGEWRERNLSSTFGKDDMEFEYQGEKGFAGTLAKYESEFLRQMMGSTKAHEDAKIRTLIAVHRYGAAQNEIVVGQPIIQHNDQEKQKIKDMLKGQHTITVNGITKTFTINRVEVAAEGGAVYWALNTKAPLIRIIDIGSGTVNYATIEGGRYIDKDSSSLEYGAESTKSQNVNSMVESIIAQTSKKWRKEDVVLIAGGMAEEVQNLVSSYYNEAKAIKVPYVENGQIDFAHPVYANALAFLNIARGLYCV